MRINHKSDFDFRLDLYAADPYGTAVASGFPQDDFTGKLFIGPSVRGRQCYTFSKQGNKLVNCYENGGHLQIVVSGHNLHSGPLYCEFTQKLADSHYPGGYRSVVHTFPLNIYLTDTDAEQISPTVSVTLPVIAPQNAVSDSSDNTSGNNVVARVNSRFAEPWLSPRVCGGHFRSGAYAGNFYRNDRGMLFLSGEKICNDEFTLKVHIPTLMKLGIEDLTTDNLISKVKLSSDLDVEYTASIDGNFLILVCHSDVFPGYYLKIEKSPYATITPDGSLKFYNQCPIFDYKPNPVTFEEVKKAAKRLDTLNPKLILAFDKKYIFQKWERNKKARVYKEGLTRFTTWKKPRVRDMCWKTKYEICERVDVRPLFFRVARKKHGAVSEWLYFKALHKGDNYSIYLIQTDETGASMTTNSIGL